MRIPRSQLLLIILSICTACGGGSSSGSNNNDTGQQGSTPLVTGSPHVDTSAATAGHVSITFPDAIGDHPVVTTLTVEGASANGIADLRNTFNSTFDITKDDINIYFPSAGNYTLTINVDDLGDTTQQRIVNVTIPNSHSYPLNGTVQDGPTNSNAGIRTTVRLHWDPINYPSTQIAITESNEFDNGKYRFSNLVGPASFFRIAIDKGTH